MGFEFPYPSIRRHKSDASAGKTESRNNEMRSPFTYEEFGCLTRAPFFGKLASDDGVLHRLGQFTQSAPMDAAKDNDVSGHSCHKQRGFCSLDCALVSGVCHSAHQWTPERVRSTECARSRHPCVVRRHGPTCRPSCLHPVCIRWMRVSSTSTVSIEEIPLTRPTYTRPSLFARPVDQRMHSIFLGALDQ